MPSIKQSRIELVLSDGSSSEEFFSEVLDIFSDTPGMNARPTYRLILDAAINVSSFADSMNHYWEQNFKIRGILTQLYETPSLLKRVSDLAVFPCLKFKLHGGFELVSHAPIIYKALSPRIDEEMNKELLSEFRQVGKREFLRRKNEPQFQKLIERKEYLLDQQSKGLPVDPLDIASAIKWENAFRECFDNHGIDVLYHHKAEATQNKSNKTIVDEELAEFYVNCMIAEKIEEPSQNQLEKFSGIAQSTWSKRLKKAALLKLIQKRIDEILDRQEKLTHAKEIIEHKINQAKVDSKAYRLESLDAKAERKSDASFDEANEIEEQIDEELIERLNDEEIIQEILKMDPLYKIDQLKRYSRDELITLFKAS